MTIDQKLTNRSKCRLWWSTDANLLRSANSRKWRHYAVGLITRDPPFLGTVNQVLKKIDDIRHAVPPNTTIWFFIRAASDGRDLTIEDLAIAQKAALLRRT